MKAKKRNTDTPLPEPIPGTMYVVYQDRECIDVGYNVDVMMRRAVERGFKPRYVTMTRWEEKQRAWEFQKLLDHKLDAQPKEKPVKVKAPKPKRQVVNPTPTFDLMRANKLQYQRIKAAYFAGGNLWWLSERTKQQFEAFRPTFRHVVLASECLPGKTKVHNGGKWRPLQSGMDIDRCLQVMEHEDDVNWDHQ